MQQMTFKQTTFSVAVFADALRVNLHRNEWIFVPCVWLGLLVSVKIFNQGWVENSTASIYRWNLPVFTGMANKTQVATTGK